MKKYSHIPDEIVEMVDKSDAHLVFPRHPHEIFMTVNQIMILKEGKYEELNQNEKNWFKMYNALMIHGMRYEMENDPEYVESIFENFMNGELDKIDSDDASRELFWSVYLKYLIDSEEYEKYFAIMNRKNK